ncbi:unnamed protein product [Heligmosomoides polygyrus]|uniref:Uncharacterized protein n=1 Tax=Heligmosomoides polygyrus TaxID=6339 RepID=A0A183F3D8_HELPZ|nr:unnamed protein product [Heligmosomoides polygyrus]
MICVGFLRYLSMIGVDRLRESLQSEAVVGVAFGDRCVSGLSVNESSQSKVSWSWLSDVVTRGQPSKFGSSELEDSHRIRCERTAEDVIYIDKVVVDVKDVGDKARALEALRSLEGYRNLETAGETGSLFREGEAGAVVPQGNAPEMQEFNAKY